MREAGVSLSPLSRPRARERAEAVLVDGQVVVPAGGSVHLLNATAALVWQCCDGEVSVAELSAEVAEVFGEAPELVLAETTVLLAELVASGLVEVEDRALDGQAGVPTPLHPESSCASCGDGPDFDSTVLVALGPIAISIGADRETADALEASFGRCVLERTDGRPGAPPAYGIVLPAGPRRAGPQPMARLHRGPEVLCASREPERVVRALVAQLATHAMPAGGARLDALVVGRAGRAVLVPVPRHRAPYLRSLAAVGLRAADVSSAVIVGSPFAAVVGADHLGLDLDPLLEVAVARMHLGTEPDALPWGTYDVAAIAVPDGPTAARVLSELAPLRSAAEDAACAVDLLVEMVDVVPLLDGSDLGALAEWLS